MRGMGLRAGTGTSRASGAAAAGREAAGCAMAALGDEPPALVIVFTSVRYDLGALLAAVREVTGDTPLVGASSDGAFTQGTHVPAGTGVAVLVVTAGAYRFGVAAVVGISADMDGAGRALARAARAAVAGDPGPHAALMLLADGLAGDQQQLIHGVYRVTGAQVPLVGGTAGDDREMRETFVFRDGEVLRDAAVAVWVASAAPLRVVAVHGWTPSGVPLLVTRADGFMVRELDGRPAAVAYADVLQGDAEAHAQEVPGTRFPLRRLRPLGLMQPDGSYVIRSVQTHVERPAIDPDELVAFGTVPSGAAVQIMRGSPATLLEASRDLATAALKDLGDPGVVLAFSCALHQDIYGVRAGQESRDLQDAAGEVPTFGVHTYGEFARTVGVLGFHNATMTGLAL